MMLTSCCCGCSLKTGSYIIGWIFSILGGLGVLAITGLICYINNIPNVHNPDVLYFYTVVFSIILIGCVIHEGMNILLLVGVKRESTVMLKTWVVFMIIVLIMKCISVIYLLIHTSPIPEVENRRPVHIIGGSISAAIMLYCILVVNSHHNEVREKRTGKSNAALMVTPPYKQFV